MELILKPSEINFHKIWQILGMFFSDEGTESFISVNRMNKEFLLDLKMNMANNNGNDLILNRMQVTNLYYVYEITRKTEPYIFNGEDEWRNVHKILSNYLGYPIIE